MIKDLGKTGWEKRGLTLTKGVSYTLVCISYFLRHTWRPRRGVLVREVMTVKQLAEYLQLSEMTIYKLANSSSILATKVGRCWRFRKQLVDEWLENGGKPWVARVSSGQPPR